ncbi:MAG: hypothetical protein CSA11_05170 [Chloroflexi bacterium]|nr:MAG: hypothetical protein CSA11_05170 [Chloroflexota bacterium]
MRLGKDLTGKPIISITDGRLVGYAKDLYTNIDLYWITGIYTGSEGLIGRKDKLIHRDNVVVFGIDAILVKNAEVETDNKAFAESENWQRLDRLRGRGVDTPGGTKVGTIGDIIVGEDGQVTGFSLSRVHIEGPVADKGTLPRDAVVDTGHADGLMTIDLQKVEIYHSTTEDAPADEQSENL